MYLVHKKIKIGFILDLSCPFTNTTSKSRVCSIVRINELQSHPEAVAPFRPQLMLHVSLKQKRRCKIPPSRTAFLPTCSYYILTRGYGVAIGFEPLTLSSISYGWSMAMCQTTKQPPKLEGRRKTKKRKGS